VKRFFGEVFSVFSRFLNVLSGDTADITLSARAHRDALWIEPYIDKLFEVLTGELGHCQNWWEHEVERSMKVVDAATGGDL
jgi:hypothetical protein